MNYERLPRWPLSMYIGWMFYALFGWLIPEQHQEFKQLLQENRRLRRKVRRLLRSRSGS